MCVSRKVFDPILCMHVHVYTYMYSSISISYIYICLHTHTCAHMYIYIMYRMIYDTLRVDIMSTYTHARLKTGGLLLDVVDNQGLSKQGVPVGPSTSLRWMPRLWSPPTPTLSRIFRLVGLQCSLALSYQACLILL